MSVDTPKSNHVLVVDDENGPRQALRMLLKETYEVHIAENAVEALEAIENFPIGGRAEGGEARDLPLVPTSLESADLGHVGVVHAERVEGGHVVQVLPLPAAKVIDVRGVAVARRVECDREGILEAARVVGGGGVCKVVPNELDRTFEPVAIA